MKIKIQKINDFWRLFKITNHTDTKRGNFSKKSLIATTDSWKECLEIGLKILKNVS